ncbi:hypothetical protein [Chryseobacterium mulctrae]|uniref:hypothetical protein n=1 Tax=Chryseobacterium mulctrae TaxID=2576777 RepID=UPI001115F476|nr:hypothetical protein [Chryseobacterium mulctrae]
MKKKILLFLIFSYTLIFSQNKTVQNHNNFLLMSNWPRVFVNKKVIAYSFYQSHKINGKEKTSTNNPSLDNPFNIYISSDEVKASVRINNKNMKEDMFFSINKIYKVHEDANDYEFLGDKNCTVSYSLPGDPTDHQKLVIDCYYPNDERLFQIFTISQYHEIPR